MVKVLAQRCMNGGPASETLAHHSDSAVPRSLFATASLGDFPDPFLVVFDHLASRLDRR